MPNHNSKTPREGQNLISVGTGGAVARHAAAALEAWATPPVPTVPEALAVVPNYLDDYDIEYPTTDDEVRALVTPDMVAGLAPWMPPVVRELAEEIKRRMDELSSPEERAEWAKNLYNLNMTDAERRAKRLQWLLTMPDSAAPILMPKVAALIARGVPWEYIAVAIAEALKGVEVVDVYREVTFALNIYNAEDRKEPALQFEIKDIAGMAAYLDRYSPPGLRAFDERRWLMDGVLLPPTSTRNYVLRALERLPLFDEEGKFRGYDHAGRKVQATPKLVGEVTSMLAYMRPVALRHAAPAAPVEEPTVFSCAPMLTKAPDYVEAEFTEVARLDLPPGDVTAFANETLEPAPGNWLTKAAVYEKYCTWSAANGRRALAENRFGIALKAWGAIASKANGGPVWRNVQWRGAMPY